MNGSSILVVEDEAIVAADLEERLSALGYSVFGVAATGMEAIGRAEANPPDLVLMDVVLRGAMDGIEAASKIRERADTPIVFLTASGDKETLDRLRNRITDGYIRKPFDDRTLEMAIELAILRHSAERERTRLIAELEESLARVRTLEGLLPICATCKNIRDDRGEWQRIESYIASRTGATFTHGLCPICAAAMLASIER